MLNTLVVYVENKPGVLTRVASLFRRRAFNIESLTVGHSDRPGVSRMTIAVDTDELGARRIEAHIYKLVNVLRVENITGLREVLRPYGALERVRTGRVARWRGFRSAAPATAPHPNEPATGPDD